MREGFIYLVTNTVNGKKYVGKTVRRLRQRWSSHLCDARKGSELTLHRAIRKYDKDAFTVEVVAESLEPFLSDLEVMAIRLYCCRVDQHGYNMTEGGEGAANPSEITRQKMRSAKQGKKLSPEHCRNLSIGLMGVHKGAVRTPATRAKIAASLRGNVPWNKGTTVTPEIRARQSEYRKGRPWTAARRAAQNTKKLEMTCLQVA